MTELIERAGKLKIRRDILRSRNANIQADISWFSTRHQKFAVDFLKDLKRQNDKKIARLERRINRIENKYANKGQHVLRLRKKEKN